MEEREFKVGDEVIYYRTPTEEDWGTVGKINYSLSIGDECIITEIFPSSNRCVTIKKGSYEIGWLPKEIFRLKETEEKKSKNLNLVEAGEYIVMLSGEFSRTDCGKVNYCFKQRVTANYMAPVKDLKGDMSNSRSYVSFDNQNFLTSWRYATTSEIEEYDRLDKPYDVTTLLEKNPVTSFRKGDYIVTLEVIGGTNCAKENYCFKQRVDYNGLSPVRDLNGADANSNGRYSSDKKQLLKDWRYATKEEIDEYNRLGKPYDVTSLCSKTVSPSSSSTSKTYTSDDLVAGEIYKLRDEYLFMSGGKRGTIYYIDINVGRFVPGGQFAARDGYLDATPEEKEWIKACIEKDDYISFEEFKKSMKIGEKSELLAKAIRDYPIGTKYLDAIGGLAFTVTTVPTYFPSERGARCIAQGYDTGLLYDQRTDTWATILPPFKVGDYVTVLDTPNVRLYNPKGIGHTFKIGEGLQEILKRFMKGETACLDENNRYGINFKLGDIRLATSAEVKMATTEYKFKVGEKVEVTEFGRGIGSEHIGKKCTITEQGFYGSFPGYKIDPPMGNTLTGAYKGFIGETMFSEIKKEKGKKIEKDPKEAFKVGDWAEIVNLDNGAYSLEGIIGHKGEIVKIREGMYYLEPSCLGSCWYAKNLRKIKSPKIKESLKDQVKKFKPIDPIHMSWDVEVFPKCGCILFDETIVSRPDEKDLRKPIIIPVKKI